MILGGGAGDDEATADAAALFGVGPEEAAEIVALLGGSAQEDDGSMILPADCREAILLFDAIATQWRTGGMEGARYGLDFTALDVAARWLRIDPSPRLMTDITTMESAGLALFAEERR